VNSFTIHDQKWAEEIQRDLEEYMGKCWEQADAEFYEEAVEEFETLSGQPFCGCGTCEAREILFFYTPRLLKAAQEGKVTLEE
jgi:hypothetical protein